MRVTGRGARWCRAGPTSPLYPRAPVPAGAPGAGGPREPGAAGPPRPTPAPAAPTAALPPILAFVGSVLLIPMIPEMLSLVETGLLGNFAPTVELAALAPASLVYMLSVYAFTGLGVQALSDASGAIAREDVRAASETVSTALAIGIAWGAVTCLALQALGGQALALLCASPEMLAHATAFLRIKAWALPASIAVFVCNSTHMAQRRQVRALALQLVGMAGAVALDAVLIGRLGLGVRGAAATAVVSQYGILAMQLASARQLARAGGVRLSVRMASASVAANTLRRLGPLSVMYVTKTLAYCTITAAAALTGLVNAAAHQAMWPTFVVCSFLNAPMEAATLTFLPTARTDGERERIAGALRATALGLGLGAAGVWTCVNLGFTGVLTKDPSLWPLIRGEALVGALTLAVTGIDIAAGGVLLVHGQGVRYAAVMCAALATAVAGTRAALAFSWGLPGVWGSLLAMMCVRVVGTNASAFFVADPWGLRKLLGRRGGVGAAAVATADGVTRAGGGGGPLL